VDSELEDDTDSAPEDMDMDLLSVTTGESPDSLDYMGMGTCNTYHNNRHNYTAYKH
jgi:hypothetical protein